MRENRTHGSMRRREATPASRQARAAPEASRRPYRPAANGRSTLRAGGASWQLSSWPASKRPPVSEAEAPVDDGDVVSELCNRPDPSVRGLGPARLLLSSRPSADRAIAMATRGLRCSARGARSDSSTTGRRRSDRPGECFAAMPRAPRERLGNCISLTHWPRPHPGLTERAIGKAAAKSDRFVRASPGTVAADHRERHPSPRRHDRRTPPAHHGRLYARAMPIPEPMLSTRAARKPSRSRSAPFGRDRAHEFPA